MRQRAALIRTLARDPDILMLDEPFSALDYQTRLEVCDDISSIIKENKKTAILVTHDLSEAVSTADRILVLPRRPGRVKAVILLALWELGAFTGVIDSFIFSSPSRVAACFLDMAADGSIFMHTGVTVLETIASFLIVVVCGLGAALILWSLPGVSAVLEPYLVMLNSLPKSALAPILIVWLGSNMRTIIVAAVSVAVFGSIITLHNGFLQTDQEQIKLIYSLGGSKRDVLTKLLLPAAVPLILSNMKVNVGLCLVGVIIGEFLAAQAGLGYLIIYGSQVF